MRRSDIDVILAVILLSLLLAPALTNPIRLPSYRYKGLPLDREDNAVGTRWAILVAGSNGYKNYRHQADICDAYQIMKNVGLKDENIIIFMYDDIACSEENPISGTIIKHPNGYDVFAEVPKDYVGKDVNVDNFFAVLLGNKTALSGGSGKVVNSGPEDHIFIFYSDDGESGFLGMPTYPYLYANDMIEVLKKKHASRSYKSMVFYLETCHSSCIYEDLLGKDINIYATTATNANESSWETYYLNDDPKVSLEFSTCSGDLYSVSWMEDSDMHNLRTETLKQQYELVKAGTSVRHTYWFDSNVMQFGDLRVTTQQKLSSYVNNFLSAFVKRTINRYDDNLLYFRNMYFRAREGSSQKLDAHKKLIEVMAYRLHINNSIELIGNMLFGFKRGLEVLKTIRPSQPIVDDWSCLESVVKTFEAHCGPLTWYGIKYGLAFANICNEGVSSDRMAEVCAKACTGIPSIRSRSLHLGRDE